jgi:hypothetical protein
MRADATMKLALLWPRDAPKWNAATPREYRLNRQKRPCTSRPRNEQSLPASFRIREGQVHPVGCVAAGMMNCHCNVLSSGRGDLSPATRLVDRFSSSRRYVLEDWSRA